MSGTKVVQILSLGEKNNIEELRKFVAKLSGKEISDIVKLRLGRSDFSILWNYLLDAFDVNSEVSRQKKFSIVKVFLDELLRIELHHKYVYDLINRLCQELGTFSKDHLLQVVDYCLDCLRAGDPKCLSWKDLLPETLRLLCLIGELEVDGCKMTGIEYKKTVILKIFRMTWPVEILTPLADMFKDVNFSPSELQNVLNKFCNAFQFIAPNELPALSFQLFGLCVTASDILIPIFALDTYFHRFYYKNLYANLYGNTSQPDEINTYSEQEYRDAEITILYHLNYCTQHKISEIQLCAVLKNLSSLADIILTPFFIRCLLTMATANRKSEIRLSNSPVLHFIRSVIKNNEEERRLSDYSVWCRDTFQKKQIELVDLFSILLIENKNGNDSVTPGIINLIFLLLKTKDAPELNRIAMTFLSRFIHNRYVFSNGIVKKISEWMVVEQDADQYAECLTLMSVTDAFTLSESIKTIKYVLDFFLWLPGAHVMRMMSFIFPILKVSSSVRDILIDALRKCMNSSNIETRRMAVYGFCMILKQLNNSNSHRSQHQSSSFFTQQSISGVSLMSQATLGARSNPQRHFDMLTLEIIGVLRNCFTEPLTIKLTLYENLQRAVELNPKLIPHVLQFIDSHFRSYFCLSDTAGGISVKFSKICKSPTESPDKQSQEQDDIGKLLLFVSHCLSIFDKYKTDYDVREIVRHFELAIEKLVSNELKFNETERKDVLLQQVHFIEGLLAYAVLMSKKENSLMSQVVPLFRIHQKFYEKFKAVGKAKKGTKKLKSKPETDKNMSLAATRAGKKFATDYESIWDLVVIERLLRATHEEIVSFALPNACTSLRSNVALVQFVLFIAGAKVDSIQHEPEYKQLKNSKRTLKYLIDITRVVYEQCIKRLPVFWETFDKVAASLSCECLFHCISVANSVYKKEFHKDFMKSVDMHVVDDSRDMPSTIHGLIDQFMVKYENLEEKHEVADADTIKVILMSLLKTLEVIYDNLSYSNRMTTDSYTWALNFCKRHAVDCKELFLIHKLLFTQREKTHSGAFFDSVAMNLGEVLGTIQETHKKTISAQLKSITLSSAESCLQNLFVALKSQLDGIEYFIAKATNMNYKMRFIGEENKDIGKSNLRSLERGVCSQLIHVSNTFLCLSNVCIPLGSLMDGLVKLLIQMYNCLKDLTRHFLSCSSNFSFEGSKFDVLLRIVGKPLSSNIYALITYIEANILDTEKKTKKNPQVEKAKVLKETKLIPKLILCIENFNKHVIFLSKKANIKVSNLLHLGTVRDFRIKTGDLKAVIERTLSLSNEIEFDKSDEENQTSEQLSDNESEEDEEEQQQQQENVPRKDSESEEETRQSDEDSSEGEMPSVAVTKKINEKASNLENSSRIRVKRNLRSLENNQNLENKTQTQTEAQTKRRRLRTSRN